MEGIREHLGENIAIAALIETAFKRYQYGFLYADINRIELISIVMHNQMTS